MKGGREGARQIVPRHVTDQKVSGVFVRGEQSSDQNPPKRSYEVELFEENCAPLDSPDSSVGSETPLLCRPES